MSLLGEIKRRKVFQVAAVYAVVAWLIIQIIDVVGEPLNLPGWIDAVVIVLLAVGFPIAVILAWAFDLTPQGVAADAGPQENAVAPQVGGQRVNYLLQMLVLLAVGFLVVDQYVFEPGADSTATSSTDSASSTVVRSNVAHLDSELIGQNTFDANIAISPDGQHIAYIAGNAVMQGGRRSRLYLRALDTLEPELLSEAARAPFFSSDGQRVGFLHDVWQIGMIARTGGPVVPIAEIAGPPRGATWASDDTVIFAAAREGLGLFEVSAAGGEPVLLTTPDGAAGELGHMFPQFLPGERAVLFTILSDQGAANSQVAVLDLETNEYRVLISGGHYARYTASGHIVYAIAGTLRAVPFDLENLEVLGTPVPVLEGVVTKASGAASYAISENGTLVYFTGNEEGEILRTAVWVDRDGNEEPLGMRPCRCRDPSVSPDGTRVAFVVQAGATAEAGSDIWIWSSERRTLMRLTFDQGQKWSPLWSPDGEKIAYWVAGQGVFSRAADGTGTAEQLLNAEVGFSGVFSWSADGQILYHEQTLANGRDIGVFDVNVNRERQSLLTEPFDEMHPSLSPDGRWLAYESSESGGAEIFVRPFPDVESGKWQISYGGGSDPKWNTDGSQLFYLNLVSVVAVPIDTNDSFAWGAPERVIDRGNAVFFGAQTLRYGMSPDGQRFLLMEEEATETVREPPQIVVVQNWFEDLNRLVPKE